jgi:hypothetical protein
LPGKKTTVALPMLRLAYEQVNYRTIFTADSGTIRVF